MSIQKSNSLDNLNNIINIANTSKPTNTDLNPANPDNPDNPDNPNKPDNPDNPDNPNNRDNPNNPDTTQTTTDKPNSSTTKYTPDMPNKKRITPKKQNTFPSLDNKNGPLTTNKHYDDKNKDNQIKDILRDYSSKITPTVINPMQLGTQDEFGGTSGINDEQLDKIRKVNNDNIQFRKDNYTRLQRYDYDKKMAVENEEDSLDRYNRMINKYNEENKYKYNIYHLSLQQILINMIKTFILIFNEILYEIKYSPKFTLSTIIQIFLISDRLFYVGLFLIFISIFLMIIQLFN